MSHRLFISAAAAILIGSPALAQTSDGACAGLSNSVCISQVGSFNVAAVDQSGARSSSASVRVQGDFNGRGTIAGRSAALDPLFGGAAPAPLETDELESGTIHQSGPGNRAVVAIEGDSNQFHVTQSGDGNAAIQLVRGNDNQSGLVQAGDASSNVARQVQLGSGNVSILTQTGAGNAATLIQAPEAEAALLSSAAASGEAALMAAFAGAGAIGADGNSILLDQNGGGNEANLVQSGSDHQIALRQQGNAQISITQYGTGRSVAVDQPAGSQGIQITQY
jgi:hypothetical protein